MTKSNQKQKNNLDVLALVFAFVAILFLVFFSKKKPHQEIEVFEIPELEKEESLNKRQEKILKLLSSKGEVTVEELMTAVRGVSERTLRRDMKRLEELGFSKKEGSTKGSKYIYMHE